MGFESAPPSAFKVRRGRSSVLPKEAANSRCVCVRAYPVSAECASLDAERGKQFVTAQFLEAVVGDSGRVRLRDTY